MKDAKEQNIQTGETDTRIEHQHRTAPVVPDHEMVRPIGRGSYGEVWLARSTVGTWRAVKIVYRDRFREDRPYEREFSGIQKYEPLSRTNEGLVDVLQIGRNDVEGYFYYVMELADPAAAAAAMTAEMDRATEDPTHKVGPPNPSAGKALLGLIDPKSYQARTLAQEIRARGRLPAEECITLGLTLSLALGHLHRHGLIHRDVKPSNIILVNGVPKLADIGLVTDLADAQSFVGTEGFIPPEGPNSPSADLYALGKVLYEASMGKDRHDFPDPFTGGLGTDAESIALMELNEVLLKACSHAVGERYRSAEDMHADLALLHSGRSVRDKHALERRLQLTRRVAAGVIAALVLAVIPYSWAIREARVAKTEAAKRRQVATFLERMLKAVGPSKAKGRDTEMLREILNETANSIGTELKGQPAVECEIRRVLGRTYMDLGLYSNALAMAQEALRLSRQLFGEHSLFTGDAASELGAVLVNLRDWAGAESSHSTALGIYKRFRGESNTDTARCLVNLGIVRLGTGRYGDAERLLRQGLDIWTKLSETEHDGFLKALIALTSTFRKEGKLPEAEKTAGQALNLCKTLNGELSPDFIGALNNLSSIQQEREDFPAAEQTLKRALVLARGLGWDEHPYVATLLDNLGAALQCEEKLPEAEFIGKQALALQRKLFGNHSPRVAGSLVNMGVLLRCTGDSAAALTNFHEAVRIYQSLPDHDPTDLASALDGLGNALRDRGQFVEAEAAHQQELSIERAQKPQNLSNIAVALDSLSETLLMAGKPGEAQPHAEQSVDLRKEEPESWQTGHSRSLLGRILAAQAQYEKAEQHILEGYKILKKQESRLGLDGKPCLQAATQAILRLYESWNKPDKLAVWRAQLGDEAKPHE